MCRKFILYMNKNIKIGAGFTLIELVISIFILSVAIIGVANAFNVITILTSDSTNKITAAYLAQEGMEIVRNIRDTNWLIMDNLCKTGDCSSGVAWTWNNGFDQCSNGCEMDYTTRTDNKATVSMITPWSSNGRYLKIDQHENGNGFHGYSANLNSVDSKFKRKITITNITDTDNLPYPYNHIVKARVEVSWDVKATILDISGSKAGVNCVEGKNCVIAEETLYNWYFPKH